MGVNEDSIDKLTAFREILEKHTKLFGLAKYKELKHHVDLLLSAVDQQLLKLGVKKKAISTPAKEFLAVYATQYRILTDFEWGHKASPKDMRIIQHICEALDRMSCTPKDYLTYLFEEIFPNNERLCPPKLGYVCSDSALQEFQWGARELIKRREEEAKLRIMERDLFTRARKLGEKTGTSEKCATWMIGYREGNISIEELRKRVVNGEAKMEEEEHV